MTKTRTETDTFGPIEVDADRYWGAQTAALARQLQDRLGERMPQPIIRALGIIKRAAAEINMDARPARSEARRGDRRGRARR